MSHSFLSVSFRTLALNPPLLFSGACRQYRGSQSLTRRTLVGGKKSLDNDDKYWEPCRRCKKLFNSVVPNNNTALHTLSSTEASRDHRTEEEMNAILPWVCWFGLLT